MFLDILSWCLIIPGLFFAVTGAVGLFKLPDFFTRMHAASVADTSCAALILIGLMLNSGFSLITVKLVFILLLLWFTGPISSHSLVKAARASGLEPVLAKREKENRITD